MLVLTRRANQSIMIGHEIVVTVLEVRGDQVRLGIKAPRSIDVHREEIFVAARSKRTATRSTVESRAGVARTISRRAAKAAPHDSDARN